MAHLTESKTIALLSVVFVLPLLVLACSDFDDRAGSSGLTPTLDLSAAGVWKGEYTGLNPAGDSGGLTLVIEQEDDGTLFGCSCWTQAACWDDGPLSGSVKGGIVQQATMLNVLRQTQINGDIEISGNKMTGVFEVVLAKEDNCSDRIDRVGAVGTLLGMQRVPADVDVLATCDDRRDYDPNLNCADFVIPLD